MESAKTIALSAHPQEYFKKLVQQALNNQRLAATKFVEYYLITLLAQYLRIENLYDTKNDRLAHEPLAILFHKAIRAQRSERVIILKRLGDLSLYISGFFSDSLMRKIIDVDYYKEMGEMAYIHLARLIQEEAFREVYKDLGCRFVKFADILAEVSEETLKHSNRNLLRLYEKWLKTKSERLARLLKEQGIIPIDIFHTSLQ